MPATTSSQYAVPGAVLVTASPVRMPAVCVSRCRMVIGSLPCVANSGRWSATRSSSSSSPRSHCCATATATDGLVIENHTTIESGVIGTPARAWPIPRSATTLPSTDA